jgi:hypothetical protein
MKKNPIIIRYVNVGWALVCGENLSLAKPKFSPVALAKAALISLANRVRGVFCFCFFSCGASSLRVKNEPPFCEAKAELTSLSKEYIERRERCWNSNIKSIEQFNYVQLDYKGSFTNINLIGFEEHQSQIATLIQSLSH